MSPRWRAASSSSATSRTARSARCSRQATGCQCCLDDPARPLTHTLGYALRGVLEAHRFTGDRALLEASRRTAEGLLTALGPDGFLPGRLGHDWRPAVRWACLTGTAQIAICWFLLHRLGAGRHFLDAARRANRFVRRTMRVDGPPETRGAVKGSFPVGGEYQAFAYPNWACKFAVDASLLERALVLEGAPGTADPPVRSVQSRPTGP